MGLLDDAIREHLDLKRRRGADPTEVSRQEHEALGPVRRDQAPGDDDGEPDVGAEDPDAEPGASEPLDTEPGGAVPPSAPSESTDEWGFDDEESKEQEPEPEPEEDVLEETPEFLSETPEHERLWFEQKPPRDFDFDG
jgi:hypothetical protein